MVAIMDWNWGLDANNSSTGNHMETKFIEYGSDSLWDRESVSLSSMHSSCILANQLFCERGLLFFYDLLMTNPAAAHKISIRSK